MNSPHRTKRMKNINGSQESLTKWSVKEKPLTSMEQSILHLSKQGLHPAAIAKRLGTSRANISYHAKKLSLLGLVIPHKIAKSFNKTRRGGYATPYDVRWRIIQFKLSENVKLPFEREWEASGVRHTGWWFKNTYIEQIFGKKGKSVLISVGRVDADSPDMCDILHDQKVLVIYDQLCESYPELKKQTKEVAVCRDGELAIHYMQGLAEEVYRRHGTVISEYGKVDASPPLNQPELQLFKKAFATKGDFMMFADEIKAMRADILGFKEMQGEIVKGIRELVGIFKGKPEPEAPSKPKEPIGGDYL